MKKILIIGKNSFIGKSFVELMSDYIDRYEVEAISIRDDSWRNESFKNFNVVLHLAAVVHQSEIEVSYDVYD